MANLEQLKTELYNIAKPLRSSNNHAPSETLIENEIMMINHMRKKSEYGRTGNQIAEKDKCKNCNGKKVVKEKKVLECVVEKGAPDGE